jgi:hypothetical protein
MLQASSKVRGPHLLYKGEVHMLQQSGWCTVGRASWTPRGIWIIWGSEFSSVYQRQPHKMWWKMFVCMTALAPAKWCSANFFTFTVYGWTACLQTLYVELILVATTDTYGSVIYLSELIPTFANFRRKKASRFRSTKDFASFSQVQMVLNTEMETANILGFQQKKRGHILPFMKRFRMRRWICKNTYILYKCGSTNCWPCVNFSAICTIDNWTVAFINNSSRNYCASLTCFSRIAFWVPAFMTDSSSATFTF